ncbi:mitochondrial PGP phosphatase-domain-containing protein [Amylostereum chailletii]|nr:mitochondrial PGP phosphatase-domain-containing protein [Amylostereum chailletii]
MPFNLPGTLVPLYALFNPRILVPHISVADIRQLDFAALRRAGYKGAVFDKDNCLTIPHDDILVPEVKDAWDDCLSTFGPSNVLIVSNSAGTSLDPGNFQVESVTHHLRTPVLRHRSLKPSYTAASAVRAYFASLATPLAPHELVVVGDRIFTDVVLAHRLGHPSSFLARVADRVRFQQYHPLTDEKAARDWAGSGPGPLSVWMTGVWKKESMLMRRVERALVDVVERFVPIVQERRFATEERFVKPPPVVEEPRKEPGRSVWIWHGVQWMARRVGFGGSKS